MKINEKEAGDGPFLKNKGTFHRRPRGSIPRNVKHSSVENDEKKADVTCFMKRLAMSKQLIQ